MLGGTKLYLDISYISVQELWGGNLNAKTQSNMVIIVGLHRWLLAQVQMQKFILKERNIIIIPFFFILINSLNNLGQFESTIDELGSERRILTLIEYSHDEHPPKNDCT